MNNLHHLQASLSLNLFLYSESREDVVDEQEMENYLVCVMALQKLMQSERTLMVGIVPLQHQHQVFEIVIRDAMDMVVQDGEVILLYFCLGNIVVHYFCPIKY